MVSYSCRCLERTIGSFKPHIKSRRNTGANAGNVVTRNARMSFVKRIPWCAENRVDLISTRKYTNDSYTNPELDYQQDYQLWSPLINTHINTHNTYHGVSLSHLKKSLVRHYNRSIPQPYSHVLDTMEITIAGRCLVDPGKIYTTVLFRNKLKETARGNHIVMFTAPFLK